MEQIKQCSTQDEQVISTIGFYVGIIQSRGREEIIHTIGDFRRELYKIVDGYYKEDYPSTEFSEYNKIWNSALENVSREDYQELLDLSDN